MFVSYHGIAPLRAGSAAPASARGLRLPPLPADHGHAANDRALADPAAPAWTGAGAVAALDRLERELPNLRTALAWLLAHDGAEAALRLLVARRPLWWVRLDPSEGRRWLAAGLARSEQVAPETRADALQGDRTGATARAEAGLALSRAHGYRFGIAQALLRLGEDADRRGEFAAATACYEEALPLMRELGERYWSAMLLGDLADALLWQGDLARAAAYAEQGLAQWRELGNASGIALGLGTAAAVALARGDPARAACLYEETLAFWQALGIRRGIAGTPAGLAGVAAVRGELERAARLLGAARALGDAADITHLAHHVEYERVLAVTRARLPPAVFATAWDAGRALPLEAAIAEAMDWTGGPSIGRSTRGAPGL